MTAVTPKSRTILMIDDDAEHLKMQSLIMHAAGFRIVTLVVGSEFSFSLPERDRPGLIFLDYRLKSSITSSQVSVWMRQTFPDVPIVLLSSSSAMPVEMAGLVDGFVTKGDPEALVSLARKFFNEDDAARLLSLSPVERP